MGNKERLRRRAREARPPRLFDDVLRQHYSRDTDYLARRDGAARAAQAIADAKKRGRAMNRRKRAAMLERKTAQARLEIMLSSRNFSSTMNELQRLWEDHYSAEPAGRIVTPA